MGHSSKSSSQHRGLHQAARQKVRQLINGCLQSIMVINEIDQYILPPALGNRSGALGAIAMAMKEYRMNTYAGSLG